MKSGKELFSALRTGIKNFVTKNVFLKLLSLLFAMLLWGYVLMAQNPTRIKEIKGVTVSIEGEADLITRRLVLAGDKTFDDVTVKVRTELTGYADLGPDDIVASISLASINSEGSYTLLISPKSTSGTAISVSPSAVTVEVDSLISRRIPIEIRTVGELPEGYWASNPAVTRTEIDIEGPKAEISSIVRAVGTVELSGRTESMRESIPLTLEDKDKNVIPSDALLGQMPSASVSMQVLPRKTVPIDLESALVGADSLPANYELISFGISGSATVDIVGEEEVISGIESIAIEPVNIADSTESILETLALIVPEGVTVAGQNNVNLYVNIREKNESASFVALPIEVEGLGRKLSAELSAGSADVTVSGRLSLIRRIERGDVALYVDVTGLEAGTYELPVSLRLPSEEMMVELQSTLSVLTVTVTIRQ